MDLTHQSIKRPSFSLVFLEALQAITSFRAHFLILIYSPSLVARPMRCNFPVAPLGISSIKIIFLGTLKSANF
jgi:hypothetical protein